MSQNYQPPLFSSDFVLALGSLLRFHWYCNFDRRGTMLWIGGIKKAKSNSEPCGLLADPAAAYFEYPLRFSYQIHTKNEPTRWRKNTYISYIYIIVLSLNLGFAWGLNNLTWMGNVSLFHHPFVGVNQDWRFLPGSTKTCHWRIQDFLEHPMPIITFGCGLWVSLGFDHSQLLCDQPRSFFNLFH